MAKDRIGPDELGIDLDSGSEKQVFRWFLASDLFGKRIRQEIAADTYRAMVDAGLDHPKSLKDAGWQKIVDVLNEGNYTRYDESTASNLLETADLMLEEYDGRITNVYEASESKKDLQQRLQEFKGVGPKTAEIFMREMSGVWDF